MGIAPMARALRMLRTKLVFVIWLFAPVVNAATLEGERKTDIKHFVSQWSEGGSLVDTFSRVEGEKFSVQEGKVVYNDDLNGDGVRDFIFESFDSVGSSGDRTFSFLIQCRGYLKFVGGDYFAGIKVLESAPKGGSTFKDIEVYSYRRDSHGSIRYKGQEALTTPHLWRFNPQSERYEGESE